MLATGERETDLHHAFSLAVIAYDFCKQQELGLDLEKIMSHALVHDLLEIVTGDEMTLTATPAELVAKYEREKQALDELHTILQEYPDILSAHDEYEALDTPEAATVFVLDKTCTIWNHFHDSGAQLRDNGVTSRVLIEAWYEATKWKMQTRLQAQPPQAVYELFEASYEKMHQELFED